MIGLALAEPAPNALRYAGRRGHVESYFWRANDPERPRAVWLKSTILAPAFGQVVAEAWFIWFDGERNRTLAHRITVPISEASFSDGDAPRIRAGGFAFEAAPSGSAGGALEAPWGNANFELEWDREDSPVAAPLNVYPYRFLRTGPFPKLKATTPFPMLRFRGRIALPDEEIALDGWTGMQGHNWGKEHAFEYAWGQCVFPAHDAMLEGWTGRVKVGGQLTPRVSALVVRRGDRTYHFDTIVNLWAQHAELDRERWSLQIHGPDGEARLRMDASHRPMACLGYRNPGGHLSYCFNSKLAEVSLQVQPRRGGAFELHSAHGGALEFLRNEPDSRFEVI